MSDGSKLTPWQELALLVGLLAAAGALLIWWHAMPLAAVDWLQMVIYPSLAGVGLGRLMVLFVLGFGPNPSGVSQAS